MMFSGPLNRNCWVGDGNDPVTMECMSLYSVVIAETSKTITLMNYLNGRQWIHIYIIIPSIKVEVCGPGEDEQNWLETMPTR